MNRDGESLAIFLVVVIPCVWKWIEIILWCYENAPFEMVWKK